MELRAYQQKAIPEMREQIKAGHKKIVFVLPTGGGKSIVFGQIIKNAYDKGKVVLWLVHRRNLVMQMKDVLETHFGISPGVIMSGFKTDMSNRVQVATIQTYARRMKFDCDFKEHFVNGFFVRADVVMTDEAHRSVSETHKKVLELYQSKIILGCTATPLRADCRGLGEVFDKIVEVSTVKELTEMKFLAPARYFEAQKPDLSDVKISMGDYQVKALDKKMNKKKLIGDIVDNWLKYGENRRTIVFCVNVKHSIAVKDAFVAAGVQAEHLDARSTDDERDGVFSRMETGDTRIVCNVALYQEGLDVPDVSCIVFARPTKSLGLYRQCIGRGLRVSGSRSDCLVFDHGGVIHDNGFADDDISWSLDGKKKAYKVSKTVKEKKPVKCSVCNLVFEGENKCPDCGSPVKSFGRKIDTEDGELKELKGKKKYSIPEKRMYLGMLRFWVNDKNKNPKMVNAKYKDMFGVWPGNGIKDVDSIKPDQAFLNLMRHDMIKYAKRKKNGPSAT